MRKINKIIIVTECPLTARDNDRFGVPHFVANDFQTEVWDVSNIVRRNYTCTEEIMRSKQIMSFDDFSASLKGLRAESTLFISFLSYGMKTWRFLRSICVAGFRYVSVLVGFPPVNFEHCGLWQRLQNIHLKPLLEYAFLSINPAILGVRPPSIVVGAGGSQILDSLESYKKSSITIHCAAIDYSVYLCSKMNTYSDSTRTAVFIDEYLPFHPDYSRLGYPYDTSAEVYYPALNTMFDLLENKLGLRVVIAAHPRSEYDASCQYFGKREIVKGQTSELIQRSSLVLLHSSTSINFAILHGKPILFLTSNDLDNSPMRRYIYSLAGELSCRPINIDCISDETLQEVSLTAPTPLYERYVDRYIKPAGSRDTTYPQGLIDYLDAEA